MHNCLRSYYVSVNNSATQLCSIDVIEIEKFFSPIHATGYHLFDEIKLKSNMSDCSSHIGYTSNIEFHQ